MTLPPVTGTGHLRAGAGQTRRHRGSRKPTLAAVAREVSKAGIEVAKYEIEDGKITVVTGKPESGGPDNEVEAWIKKNEKRHHAH